MFKVLISHRTVQVCDGILAMYLWEGDQIRKIPKHRSIVVDIIENDPHFQTWVRDTVVNTICCTDEQCQGLVVGS